MAANHAVVVDHAVPGTLAIREVAPPTPLPSEALVRVAAISLNRGETRRAMEAADGWCPGWDLAGVVTQAAANGSGPRTGARVVGFLRSGAWAESVVVPTNALAALPDAVTFAQAATLPVAGLTALYASPSAVSAASARVHYRGDRRRGRFCHPAGASGRSPGHRAGTPSRSGGRGQADWR